MATKIVKRRDWTKEDIRTLKALAREKTKTTVIARRLKRSVGATYQQGIQTRCVAGGTSEEEERIAAALRRRHRPYPFAEAISRPRSHSLSFDQRRLPDMLRTAIATAFFCPTRCSMA